MIELSRKAGWMLAALGVSVLAACASPGEGGSSVGNMLLFAGPTVPPPAKAATEEVFCPPVAVMEGGSAIQAYAGGRVGDASGLRSQIALGQIARECTGQPDGSVLVSVGVTGRALLGVGGRPGRYDAPLTIRVASGSVPIATRSRRVSVAVPSGDMRGSFTVVEEGIVVPRAQASDFSIEVGLVSAKR